MGCFSSGSQSSQSYTGTQARWLNTMLNNFGNILSKEGMTRTPYEGARVAGFTPAQKAALSGTEGFLSQFSPGKEMPLFGETGKAISGLYSGEYGPKTITEDTVSKIFEGGWEKPRWKQFSEYEAPAIREEFAGPGYWGSARAGAVSKAAQDVGDWLGKERSGLEKWRQETNIGIESEKARNALSAVPLGMQYGQMPTQEAQAKLAGRQNLFGFASAEQIQNQNEINAAIQKWAEGNKIPSSLVNVMMQLLGMNYSSSSTSGPGWFGGQDGFQNFANAGYGIASGLGL